MSMMKGDEVLQKRAENFFSLCESEWKTYVSSAAMATLSRRKWNTPLVLPFTEDLKVISQHIQMERAKRLESLQKSPSVHHWHCLAKATLASVIMFNRKRSGEAARITISQYNAAKFNTTPQDDVLNSLSALEKELVRNFVCVEIPGKRGRKVPVLLTRDMVKEIDQLCASRHDVEVCSLNDYVFARPYYSSEDHISGHECLNAAAEACNINSETVTSTKLRKHIATVSQILNLKDHELDQLCQFLGHDVRIHREFYRLPDSTFQLAKISRLLVAMEQGQISDFKGKSLEEVDVQLEFQEHDVDVHAEDTLENQDGVTNVESQLDTPEKQPNRQDAAAHQATKQTRRCCTPSCQTDKTLLHTKQTRRCCTPSSQDAAAHQAAKTLLHTKQPRRCCTPSSQTDKTLLHTKQPRRCCTPSSQDAAAHQAAKQTRRCCTPNRQGAAAHQAAKQTRRCCTPSSQTDKTLLHTKQPNRQDAAAHQATKQIRCCCTPNRQDAAAHQAAKQTRRCCTPSNQTDKTLLHTKQTRRCCTPNRQDAAAHQTDKTLPGSHQRSNSPKSETS
ncbi:hypothetical protein ACOMHN_058084 [Nucella lapillus]